MNNKKELIIKLWGTREEYFKELERFLKSHENCDCRTYDQDGLLVKVEYHFRPYTVLVDHINLVEAINNENK